MKHLKQRVALVTGASAGIGYHTAIALAREGCFVAACARREDRLSRLKNEIEAAGGQCLTRTLDISDRAALQAWVPEILSRWGRLDVAVANAGYGYLARVEEIEPEKMETIWRVNFMGSLYTIQEALPHMKQQGAGHVVLISSVIGRYALPLSSAYCVTKFSQTALGQALRPELKPHGIGVTVVYPGYTATEFGEKQLHQERRKKVIRNAQPPQDVARRIVSAIRRNKKEVYPNFSGSLFAHFGMWFPWLTDELLNFAYRRMQ